jgi:TPR repeat protein
LGILFAASAPAAAQQLSFPLDACGVARSRVDGRSNSALESCAARGVAGAQAQLAMMYWGALIATPPSPGLYGLDERLTVAQLQAEGHRLMESAAGLGDATAQNELGFAYYNGDYGLPADMRAAAMWLRAGADNGDEIAPFNLARLYFSGRGVRQSYSEGEDWLRLSASRGYVPAICSLARWLDAQTDRSGRAEARALRRILSRQGWGCGSPDYMEELPLIDFDATL